MKELCRGELAENLFIKLRGQMSDGVSLMANGDRVFGALIFIICVIVGVGYFVAFFFTETLVDIGIVRDIATLKYWLMIMPVLIALAALLAIGAWIGWTMIIASSLERKREYEAEVDREIWEVTD